MRRQSGSSSLPSCQAFAVIQQQVARAGSVRPLSLFFTSPRVELPLHDGEVGRSNRDARTTVVRRRRRRTPTGSGPGCGIGALLANTVVHSPHPITTSRQLTD
jgi:hypothetical protein